MINNRTLSILIVDDHDTIISGLKYELSEKFKNVNIKVSENIKDAIAILNEHFFDIAIIDISFKDSNNYDGIELIKKIREEKPEIKLISYSAYVVKLHYLKQLQKLKVEAIVSKTDGNYSIKYAINEILLGKTFLSAEVHKATENEKKEHNKLKIKVTKRELDILKLIHKHLSYKEISFKLLKSQSTIDTHAKNLFKKFNVHTKSELIEKTKKYISE